MTHTLLNPAEHQRPRLLIVDDEPINIQILLAVFSADYDIDTAGGGYEAIAQVKKQKPDLILLDVMMPDLGGFDVCRMLKAEEPYSHIPVVFLTAMESEEGEAKGLQAGGIDYITKPFQIDLVRLRVSNHIRMVRYSEMVLQQRDQLIQQQEALSALNSTLDQQVQQAVSELREKDQLLISQSRQAAMGEMIGNIAHQWRQPLNALSMLFANLRNAHMFNDLTDEYMDKACETSNRLIQKMSTTINDFRNFFLPDKESVRFSLLHEIEHALSLVEATFTSKSIKIIYDTSLDLPMYGLPNEFSQVLLNLLNNARDAIIGASRQNGEIAIEISRDGNTGRISVRDNGGGIPDQVMAKIFDPYFSTKDMGTGIGLYMSKMIIERSMNGRIEVCNRDKGAEFTITVPLADDGKPSFSPSAQPS